MANQQLYGLFQLLDLQILDPNQQASIADSGLMVSGILMDQARHNADIDAVLRLFASPTTEYSEEIAQVASGRNQPLDENGRSLPVKPVAPYTVAYPIIGSGSAWGANFLTRQRMTNRELGMTLSRMYMGDFNWVVDHVLAALFFDTSGGYSHRDLTGRGTLTIQGLANGDTTVYYRTTTGGTATDAHYIATASAIADNANPFPIIYAELTEHPDNQGEVVAFIPTNLKATTIALAEFNPVILNVDVTPGPGSTADRLTGSLNLTLPPGAVLLGKTDSNVWIVEWPKLPDGYIVATMTQGVRPLKRRQFPEANLQGFRAAGEREDWPYFESQWHRWEGYGGANRAGAVVYRVGDATYAIPTGYESPMP